MTVKTVDSFGIGVGERRTTFGSISSKTTDLVATFIVKVVTAL